MSVQLNAVIGAGVVTTMLYLAFSSDDRQTVVRREATSEPSISHAGHNHGPLNGNGDESSDDHHHGAADSEGSGSLEGSDSDATLGEGGGSKDSSYQWTVPKSWIESDGGSMRLGSFKVPQGDLEGDCSVIMFGGDGGGLGPNINRWRTQAGLETLGTSEVLSSISQNAEGALPYRYVKILASDNSKSSILGSVFMRDKHVVFVKLTGAKAVIESSEKQFIAFCNSLRVNE